MINMIVAYDERGAIGAHGDLPWGRSLPGDLQHFKELTTGQRVIMGRKTFESIGRPLPNRENIVISRHELRLPQGVLKFGSVAVALAYGHAVKGTSFVIGGAQIYEAALPYADKIYATEVRAVFKDADTYFPELNDDMWTETRRISHTADSMNAFDYDFVEFDRIKKAA